MQQKQYVQLNNVKSEMCEIKTGVPQDSGPILFVLYVIRPALFFIL